MKWRDATRAAASWRLLNWSCKIIRRYIYIFSLLKGVKEYDFSQYLWFWKTRHQELEKIKNKATDYFTLIHPLLNSKSRTRAHSLKCTHSVAKKNTSPQIKTCLKADLIAEKIRPHHYDLFSVIWFYGGEQAAQNWQELFSFSAPRSFIAQKWELFLYFLTRKMLRRTFAGCKIANFGLI